MLETPFLGLGICRGYYYKDIMGKYHVGRNPSTRLIKGTIFKVFFGGEISRPRLISIRWNFVWGKGTRFKRIFVGDKS